jgi:Ribosomal protein L17
MPKLFDTIATRYRNRSGGYTRVHKLPPRYGDMAPLAILELVDGKRDMLFSMTARKVARSTILGTKWLSESTKDAMYRIFQFRGQNAVKEFDAEVERQKALLVNEDKQYEAWRRIKDGKTVREIEDRVNERAPYTLSPHNRKRRREYGERMELRRRKDSYMSEEDKKEELKNIKPGVIAGMEDPKDSVPPQSKKELRTARYEARQEKRKQILENRRQQKETAQN